MLLRLISRGADVNATTKINRTALKIACLNRNEEAIYVLLNAGADSNIADADGDTCLHTALGTICIADPTTAAYEGYTCLHHGGCRTENLQAMIDHGADVNALNKKNATALMIACHKRNTNAINVVLNAGADPNIPGDKGVTCIHHAVSEGFRKAMLETIINHGADVNATTKNNMTALMIACLNGNEGAINVLLNAGADSNIADVKGDTLLHFAVQKDVDQETLQAIIDHCADVNAINHRYESALLLACKTVQKEAVSLLLTAGADISIVDVYNDTCLHHVLSGEYDQETLQMLLDHGVPVNVTNKSHQTAYMLACHQGNIDAMCALLNARS